MKLLCCEIKSWVSITNTELYLPTIFISSGSSLRGMGVWSLKEMASRPDPVSFHLSWFFFFFPGHSNLSSKCSLSIFLFLFQHWCLSATAIWCWEREGWKEKALLKLLFTSCLLMSFLRIWVATQCDLCASQFGQQERGCWAPLLLILCCYFSE